MKRFRFARGRALLGVVLAATAACARYNPDPFPPPVSSGVLMAVGPGRTWNAVIAFVDARSLPVVEADASMGSIVTYWIDFFPGEIEPGTMADCESPVGDAVSPVRARFEFVVSPRGSRATMRVRSQWQRAATDHEMEGTRVIAGYVNCVSTGKWEKEAETYIRRLTGELG